MVPGGAGLRPDWRAVSVLAPLPVRTCWETSQPAIPSPAAAAPASAARARRRPIPGPCPVCWACRPRALGGWTVGSLTGRTVGSPTGCHPEATPLAGVGHVPAATCPPGTPDCGVLADGDATQTCQAPEAPAPAEARAAPGACAASGIGGACALSASSRAWYSRMNPATGSGQNASRDAVGRLP